MCVCVCTHTHTHTYTNTHIPVIWEILSYQTSFGVEFWTVLPGDSEFKSNLWAQLSWPDILLFFLHSLQTNARETTTVLFHNAFDAAFINWAIRRHIFGENNTAGHSFKWAVFVSACLRKRSDGMRHHIVWQKFTKVSRELNCSHLHILKGAAVELQRTAVDVSTVNIAKK